VQWHAHEAAILGRKLRAPLHRQGALVGELSAKIRTDEVV